MDEDTKKVLEKIFWDLEGIIDVIRPDMAINIPRDQFDMDGLNLGVIVDLIDMIRITNRYMVFDLEACRRDIQSLHKIIEDSGK